MTEQDIIAKILITLPAHVGYAGLLSQLNKDQGDTLQRTGELVALVAMYGDSSISNKIYSSYPNPEKAFALLETHSSWYRRSPDPNAPLFEVDDRETSRDQLAIAKAGMVANNLVERLWGIAGAQLLRLTFHQNYWSGTGYQIPDILTPDEAAVSLRGMIGPLSWIPNIVLDLGFLVDLAVRDTNNWDQDNMMAINLLVANWKYPTPWSKLAMSLYLKTNFMSRLWNYLKDQDGNNGCEPLYWLFRLVFLKQYGYDPGDSAP